MIEDVDGPSPITVSNGSSTISEAVKRPIRELLDDRQLDELLARSRDEAGGLRLTGRPHQRHVARGDQSLCAVDPPCLPQT
ncbi:hypothetical protein [Nonomuraea sp. NPDC048901]|uniref:hypothetical protein n=1 Tax=Nonomuraea sp. NPDC048901 TaxID=3155627 RepID=UPI00340F11B0